MTAATLRRAPAYEWPAGKDAAPSASRSTSMRRAPICGACRKDAPRRARPDRAAALRPARRHLAPARPARPIRHQGRRCSCPALVAKNHPDLLPAFVERGHEIGLHGYFHEIASEAGPEEFARRAGRVSGALQEAGRRRPEGISLAGLGDDALHAGGGEAPWPLRHLADGLRPSLHHRRRDGGSGALGLDDAIYFRSRAAAATRARPRRRAASSTPGSTNGMCCIAKGG